MQLAAAVLAVPSSANKCVIANRLCRTNLPPLLYNLAISAEGLSECEILPVYGATGIAALAPA